ncbi:CRISPR-associated endonuclease Cas3'' [Streptomyces sp. TRM 70351]|uniref:CRISPR-associated endonuclease Cas3'' n=1 Tax=Streptomyces sp. TRM 70351 TaxID=3116552 RepID=UPI002E7AE553|nr:CRISPR-associated endonuclease Cas3'' [Streptomyces sp. TRM 70351]MEE1928309.1 CRISPR-associated endonuclease Cas3'' [Streptomyces sp. TRM 70351]
MSDGVLYAHSRSDVSGVRHRLDEHLRGTAALARRFGDVFDAGRLAEYLALVHDVGKGHCAWQKRLIDHAEPTGKPVGIPHKEAGTYLAARFAGRALAAAVQGHHGGLPDQQKVKDVVAALSGQSQEADAAREAIDRVEQLIPEVCPPGKLLPPDWLGGLAPPQRQLGTDLLVRMLFSCLVDADFLDTSAHFAATTAHVAADADMDFLATRYEERRATFLATRPASPVDAVRGRVYEQAVAAAAGEPGMYVLHVPTGGAKTMAAGGFAVHHAAARGLKRVVVAVPYISITQQNAQVYRDLLDPLPGEAGEPVVLEHHSSVRLDDEDGVGRWARLAAENWDAPVVVTTTVQLFQSLFARRPSAMRKVHRLAGAVIVLDEVQALPDRLLIPMLDVLRGLVEHFGASVVLASATQPEFWSLPQMSAVKRRLMVEDTPQLFKELGRVNYTWRLDEDVTWEGIADEIAAEGGDQVLTVVNTTGDSARLHRLLTEPADPDDAHTWDHDGVGLPSPSSAAGPRVPTPVLHLSTRMTAEHRREVIERVRADLAAGRAVHVVSTSLVEAGVDIDFPRVYRAWAPAESLQQAAGRCNRDGRIPGGGTVVVFRPKDGRTPKDKSYRAALQATEEHFGPDTAYPDDLHAIPAYYAKRYALHGSDGRAMGEEIQQMRRRWDFPAVADAFEMIDDRYAQPVVVIRPEKTELQKALIMADIEALRSRYPCGPEPLRRLQPHTAVLPRHDVADALKSGLAESIVGDLVVWCGHYDPARGLDANTPEDRGGYVI